MFNWNLSGKMIEYLYTIDNKSNKCKIAYFRFYYGLIEFNIFKCGSGYYGTEFGFRPKIFRQPTAIKYPAGYFICF